jgi:hypothetical protein
MTDFWMRELYAGCDRQGRMIPRKDKDDAQDEGIGADIERRMANYQKNVPRHRRTDNERNIDPAPRRHRDRAPPPDDDNIAGSSDEDEPPRRGQRGGRRAHTPFAEPTGDARGDELDQQMLTAWMGNNGGADAI